MQAEVLQAYCWSQPHRLVSSWFSQSGDCLLWVPYIKTGWGFLSILFLCFEILDLWPVWIFSLVSASQKTEVLTCLWQLLNRLGFRDKIIATLWLAMPVPRGLIRGPSLWGEPLLFCCCGKRPSPAVPAPCHGLAGLGLEVPHILVGHWKHHFHNTTFTTFDKEGLRFLRLTLQANFLNLWELHLSHLFKMPLCPCVARQLRLGKCLPAD